MSERESHNDSVATAIERFVTELQRRKVVRVAIVYGAFAWLVLQFSDIIIEAFAAPDWVMRVLLLFLVLALPATLILAWLFDITPSGIHLTADSKEEDDDPQPSILLISSDSSFQHADSESLCNKISRKLSKLLNSYGGKPVGMHDGHCIIQFQNSGPAVSCGLAVLQLLHYSQRPVSISIAAGHYNADEVSSKAVNIAEGINHPVDENLQHLMISTAIYERELSTKSNPLLDYLSAESREVNDHQLFAFRVNPRVLKHRAIQWRLKEDKQEFLEKLTLFRRHRLLLTSMLGLVVAFTWLYFSPLNDGHEKIRSIAVMPFRSLDENTESKVVSLGLSEELQDRLRDLEGIELTPGRSARAFASKNLAVPELGEQLQVNYLVEGSTRLIEDEYRIYIALTDTKSGTLIWSRIYQAGNNELFSVQEDIINQLADHLNIDLLSNPAELQLSNKDYGAYLTAIGYFELPNAIAHLDRVESALDGILERYPNYAPAQSGLCRVHLTRYNSSLAISDYQKAAAYCESAEKSMPDNPDILKSLTQLNIAQDNWTKAKMYAKKGLLLEPENLGFLLDYATINSNTGQPEVAEEILLEAIRIEPAYWRSYEKLGLLYMSLGQLENSIRELSKAAELMPGEASVHNLLGAAYFNLGDFSAAADAFVKSLNIQPNIAAYTNTGTVYYFSGDYRKALEFNLKATQLEPMNYLLIRNLADSENTIEELKSSAIVHYNLVIRLTQDVLEAYPKKAEALSNLAWALSQTGDNTQAEEKIEQAIRLAPTNANILYDASIIYTHIGEETKAQKFILRAIDAGIPAAAIAATPGLEAYNHVSGLVSNSGEGSS